MSKTEILTLSILMIPTSLLALIDMYLIFTHLPLTPAILFFLIISLSLFFVIFHILYDLYIVIRSEDFIMPHVENHEFHPMVSIIIPIYNESPEVVSRTFKSLKKMDYPNFEIIVSDESDDAHAKAIHDVCKEEDIVFAHKEKDEIGFNAEAIRFGIRHAKSDIVAIVDSDYLVDENWLKECVPYFQLDYVNVVNCPQSYRNTEELIPRITGAFRELAIRKDLARFADESLTSSGTMVLIRKDIFNKYFTGDYITEDFAFSVRLLLDGIQTFYYPSKMGHGLGPTSAVHYAKQQMRWLDNLRIFKDYLRSIIKLDHITFIHLFYHSTQFMYAVPVVNLAIFGSIALLMSPALGISLILTYFFIELHKFNFTKYHSNCLRWRDIPAFIFIGWVRYPYLLYEVINIMVGGKVRFFRTPKEVKK